MWTTSHISQAGKPAILSRPISTMARLRPMVAIWPLSTKRNGCRGCRLALAAKPQAAFAVLPDGPHKQLTTVKGIGDATAAAIVTKVVSIDRFATAAQLVSYFGVFPEENTSGYDRWGKAVLPGTMQMSRQGNDLVRRYLWMAAQTATLHNPAIRTLFARQKSRGKRGDVALGHCMRKLLHLVFAVWKTGRPFNPQHYPWADRPEIASREKEMAAGHKEDKPLDRKVVTTATCKIESDLPTVNALATPLAPRRMCIDYAALRRQVTWSRY
jgi:hypothetical protein